MPKLEEDEVNKSIVEKMFEWVNSDSDFVKGIERFFDDHCEEFSDELDAG